MLTHFDITMGQFKNAFLVASYVRLCDGPTGGRPPAAQPMSCQVNDSASPLTATPEHETRFPAAHRNYAVEEVQEYLDICRI
jgi:hypothetical protein